MADTTLTNKVEVQRPDNSWVDITDYTKSARVKLGDVRNVGTKNGADGVAKTLDLEVQNDDDNSFAPRDRDSSWNIQGGTYAPLLWANRRVKVSTNAMILFGGYINSATKTGRHSVQTKATDLSYPLRYTHIETVNEYGSEAGVPAETVIQNIMNDHLTNPPTLYVKDSPGFAVQPYKVELYNSVWDAVTNVINQFGYYLGYRYIDSLSEFRLTLLEPPRTKDVGNYDWILTSENDYIKNDLDVSASDIRNVVNVVYTDNDATVEEGFRKFVSVTSDDSIAEYGRRAMLIEESDTSLIDTNQEALNFAQAALKDLYAPSATSKIEMPYFPEIQLFDGIAVDDPELSSTVDFYGVESVEHDLNFENQKFRTVITGGQEIVGGRKRWLQMDARKGIINPDTGYKKDTSTITTPTPVNFQFVESGIESTGKDITAYAKFSWDKPSGEYDITKYVLQVRKSTETTWDNVETRQIEATGPNMTTKIILPPRENYEARLAALSSIGKLSNWTSTVSFTTTESGASSTPQDLNAYGTYRGIEIDWLPVTETDVDYYNIYMSTTSGFTPSDTNLKAQGFQSYKSFKNLTMNTTYYVKVSAVNTSGNESGYSNQASATAGVVDWDDVYGDLPNTSSTLVVAAENSSTRGKDNADYLCDGNTSIAHSSGVQSATSTTVTLSSTASSTDDYYNYMTLVIYDGNPPLQFRTIRDYDGSTKTATIDRPFTTVPGSADDYKIFDGDQTTINKAIAEVTPDGGQIILLEGTFLINGHVELADSITLKGQGNNTIIKIADYLDLISDYRMAMLFSYNGISESYIRDIKLDGNASRNTGRYRGIVLDDATNCQIENITAVSIYDSVFENNNSTTAYGEAIQLQGIGDKNRIINCDIRYCTVGIWVYGSNTIVKNNQIDLENREAIWGIIIGASSSTYEGNHLISDNIIKNVTNSFTQAYGIRLIGTSPECQIHNNHCNNYGYQGIRLLANGHDVQNNKLRSSSASYAIEINDNNCLISNNDCMDSVESGSTLADTGTGNSAGAGNRIDDGTWSTTL